MVERYHFLKLKPAFATAEARAEVIDRVLDVLPRMPGVLRVTAGSPCDAESAAAWDVCITVRFAHLDDVARYRTHADHRRLVDEFLAPRVEVKKAWNFGVRTG